MYSDIAIKRSISAFSRHGVSMPRTVVQAMRMPAYSYLRWSSTGKSSPPNLAASIASCEGRCDRLFFGHFFVSEARPKGLRTRNSEPTNEI